MRTSFRLLLLVTAIFWLSACNKNKVNLIESNAKNEVPSLGNLTFTFDKNLVNDSLLNKWDTTGFVEFTPPIAGRFRWENANELVFSPEGDMPPTTAFSAAITKKILQFNKKLSLGRCEPLHFHTPYLQVLSTNGMWNVNDGDPNNAFPQIDIYFNYKVNPAKLKELLSVQLDGTDTKFSIQSSTSDSKISITLLAIKPEDKDLTAKIKIEKGLLPERGTSPTNQVIESTVIITSPFNMSVQNTESNHDGTQGTVKVMMSQSPLADNLNSYISFEPKVKFKAEITNEGMVITSDEFDMAKSYTLTLSK